MNVAESNAVNILLEYLGARTRWDSGLGRPTHKQATDAAVLLAGAANKRLVAGLTGDDARRWMDGRSEVVCYHDGMFDYPDTGVVGHSRCHLAVYRLDGLPRSILVATDLGDANPGASLAHSIEALVSEAWNRWQPDVDYPPITIEHYGARSDHATDDYALVQFAAATPTLPRRVHAASWTYIPRSFVLRLIDR
jgi:hypothetical protein